MLRLCGPRRRLERRGQRTRYVGGLDGGTGIIPVPRAGPRGHPYARELRSPYCGTDVGDHAEEHGSPLPTPGYSQGWPGGQRPSAPRAAFSCCRSAVQGRRSCLGMKGVAAGCSAQELQQVLLAAGTCTEGCRRAPPARA